MFSYGQVKVALSAGVFFKGSPRSAERRFVLCSMLTKKAVPYFTGGAQVTQKVSQYGIKVRAFGDLWDPQNRDPRRKPPPETEESVG